MTNPTPAPEPVEVDGVIHGAFSESVGDHTYLPRREADDE